MRMILRLAFDNAKYHKSKNVLTGIAIVLTTLLLYLVLSIGYDMVESQHAVINEIYPNWHALYRDVPEETVNKLSVHHNVTRWGLFGDFGAMAVDDADISMLYIDTEGFDMYQMELLEGRLPDTENEIVVSEGILESISVSAEIGDTITVPYQVFKNGGLDYKKEKDFVISGFIADTESNLEKKTYSAFVSKSMLESEIPSEQITYRFLFQVFADDTTTTEELELKINQLAKQFNIPEQSVRINEDYLGANYIDPTYVPAIIIIILIIVTAGVITIYSIYYVSMGERIREFGRMKAIGTTRKQLRMVVLLEGMVVAGIAIPIGLIIGTVLVKYILLWMLELNQIENEMISIMKELILKGAIRLYHIWIYGLSIAVTLLTVFVSLLRPMKFVSKVSEVEAIRYHNGQSYKKKAKERKGYQDITISRLAKVYLAGNKKKSAITIFSMAITGCLFIIVATILSSADPIDGANNSLRGEYQISPIVRSNNKEYPELEWSEVQKNNPLTEELKEDILKIEGIVEVESFKGTYVTSDAFGDVSEWLVGVPHSGKEQLEGGIIEGKASYEDLTTGDKVIVDKKFLYWYPYLKIGDKLDVKVEDGKGTHRRQLEIIAIGDYPRSFTNYSGLILAEEAIERFSDYNLNFYYHIYANEKYDAKVEEELRVITEQSGQMRFKVWKDVLEEYRSNMSMTSAICYAFLGILGAICIMNLMNTMIYSVHIRKKEIGMLQAVGMSDAQFHTMLQLEGLFYTAGTLIIAIGAGSLLGYPVFLWAKQNGIFSISNYHYPLGAASVVIVVLVTVQSLLTMVIGKSMRKESLIDRIRFSNS